VIIILTRRPEHAAVFPGLAEGLEAAAVRDDADSAVLDDSVGAEELGEDVICVRRAERLTCNRLVS